MPQTGADWVSFHRTSKLHDSSRGPYIKILKKDLKGLVFLEEEAPAFKGQWLRKVFKASPSGPLNLEIGPGIGLHFHQWAARSPQESFIAIELQYKPLAQTARRVQKAGLQNARLIRYHARFIKDLFGKGELNDIRIHFPDPWPKKRHRKRRLIQQSFAKDLFSIQRPGGELEFKTDVRDYFFEVREIFLQEGWKALSISENLHAQTAKTKEFFKTLGQFEAIFARQSAPVFRLLLQKPALKALLNPPS